MLPMTLHYDSTVKHHGASNDTTLLKEAGEAGRQGGREAGRDITFLASY